MARKKIKDKIVVTTGKYDPYLPSDPTKGMKHKKEVSPIKLLTDIVSTKEWYKYLLICLIPIINLCALGAWASKKNDLVNPSIKNFAKAGFVILLLFQIVIIVLVVMLKFVFKVF